MKILHTVRGLLKLGGGPSYTIPALAEKQAELGCDVQMLLDEDKFDYDPPVGVKVWHRSQLTEPLSCFLESFDIVHDHGIWLPNNHRVAKAARNAGVVRVISPRGALQDWVWNQRRWKKELGWLLYQRRDLLSANAIFATAQIEGDRVKELGYSGPVYELPNGVDVPGELSRGACDGVKTALFLARIHQKKGIEELIDSWCELVPKDWRLLVAGNDEVGLIPKIQDRIAGSGKPVDIRFLGMIHGQVKADAFNQSDLFILPTHSENFGVSVIEAMLMGLPVITTTGTPWQQIENDGIGWLIEPGKAALLPCLREVLNSDRTALALKGEKAKAWAQGRFVWENVAARSLQFYREILASRPTV